MRVKLTSTLAIALAVSSLAPRGVAAQSSAQPGFEDPYVEAQASPREADVNADLAPLSDEAAPAQAAERRTYQNKVVYDERCKGGDGGIGGVVGGGAGGLLGGLLIGGPVAVIAGVVGGALLGRHADRKNTARRQGC